MGGALSEPTNKKIFARREPVWITPRYTSPFDRKIGGFDTSSQDEMQGAPPQKCDGAYLFSA